MRLEEKEKELLFYFANRLGVSPSSLVRNQVRSLLEELKQKVNDTHYTNIAEISMLSGPSFSQEEIEEIFEIEG